MCLLIESIKCENRELKNLQYHTKRLNRTRFELFGERTEIDLKKEIEIPENITNEVFKCRVTYGKDIENVEFELYKKRKIDRLIVKEADIDYPYKYADRSELSALTKDLKPNEDVLILKDGLVTDTSFANVCFWDGEKWVTPDRPLLRGTKREELLEAGVLIEKRIKKVDIFGFEKFCLVNAMLGIVEIDIHKII
jgi:4-amino-4-deoxychorismate lyase